MDDLRWLVAIRGNVDTRPILATGAHRNAIRRDTASLGIRLPKRVAREILNRVREFATGQRCTNRCPAVFTGGARTFAYQIGWKIRRGVV